MIFKLGFRISSQNIGIHFHCWSLNLEPFFMRMLHLNSLTNLKNNIRTKVIQILLLFEQEISIFLWIQNLPPLKHKTKKDYITKTYIYIYISYKTKMEINFSSTLIIKLNFNEGINFHSNVLPGQNEVIQSKHISPRSSPFWHNPLSVKHSLKQILLGPSLWAHKEQRA